MGYDLGKRTASSKRAKGYNRSGMTSIAVRFDPETFDFVNAFALRRNISFAEAVRLLVEWGLEADRK